MEDEKSTLAEALEGVKEAEAAMIEAVQVKLVPSARKARVIRQFEIAFALTRDCLNAHGVWSGPEEPDMEVVPGGHPVRPQPGGHALVSETDETVDAMFEEVNGAPEVEPVV